MTRNSLAKDPARRSRVSWKAKRRGKRCRLILSRSAASFPAASEKRAIGVSRFLESTFTSSTDLRDLIRRGTNGARASGIERDSFLIFRFDPPPPSPPSRARAGSFQHCPRYSPPRQFDLCPVAYCPRSSVHGVRRFVPFVGNSAAFRRRSDGNPEDLPSSITPPPLLARSLSRVHGFLLLPRYLSSPLPLQ